MKILQVVQGSKEWHEARRRHNTASEAAAMMGVSKYITRNELLAQKATGIIKEVSSQQQRLFDKGHAVEAAARLMVEEDIGDSLYPCTAVDDDGYLLASFDGITMDDVGFECKLWNKELAESVRRGELDPHYYWQLEQQILVGNLKKVIFVCTDGTRQNYLTLDYYPVPGRSEQLLAGWTQFDRDVATYIPEPEAVKRTGVAPDMLPSLHIEIRGEVTASNLAEFKETAIAVFRGINRDLQTDQDFADAEKTVKWCADVETRLAAAKQHALSQTATIDVLFRTLDSIADESRAVRLELEKLVKAQKDERRATIVRAAQDSYAAHVTALNRRIGRPLVPDTRPDFAAAVKGKRTISSIRDAVDATLARAKIAANEAADRIADNLKAIADSGHEFLFTDVPALVAKAPEDLQATIAARIAEHQRRENERLEAERQRIRREEQERADREAEERLRREREAERARQAEEERQRQAAQPATLLQDCEPPIPEPQPVQHRSLSVSTTFWPVASALLDAGKPTRSGEDETINLRQINERLAPVSVDAATLEALGFQAVSPPNRPAKLYRESDFARICAAIIKHVMNVGARWQQ